MFIILHDSFIHFELTPNLQVGEQPLKTTPIRTSRTRKDASDNEQDGDEEESEEGMYAQFQTSLYIPPPVVSGIVPKNGFGNLDVFVPSMVPSGGVHLPSMFPMQHVPIFFKAVLTSV